MPVPAGPSVPSAAVVVGVDDSEDSRGALEWAAGEARLRGVPLRIVHALPFSLPRHGGPDPNVEEATCSLQGLAAHAQLLDERPLKVNVEVVDGLPSKVLVEESRHCALLVVGSRGHGGFTRLMLGSTAVDVTAHAACPVAVIPAGADVQSRDGGDVVVGVDDSTAAGRAVEFAFARAALRASGLVAVHVRHDAPAPGAHAPAAVLSADRDQGDAEAHAVLESGIRPWHDKYPAVAVTARVVRGDVVARLVQALDTHGDVVVVGARGRSVLAGAVRGSVSQDLLHRASGPVVIVR